MSQTPYTTQDMLCFALYSASHAMSRVYRPILKRMGLTYPQLLVLVSLWTKDGQRVTDVGRELGLDSNTLTPLVQRMEGAGLVTKERSTRDERVVTVHLTDRGRRLQNEADHIAATVFEATGLEPEEITELLIKVQRLREHLDQRD